MSSTRTYFELLELVMASKEVCISIECREEARTRKALTKVKNEQGLEDWRYFKLKYRLSPSQDHAECVLCISKYRVFKSKLLQARI